MAITHSSAIHSTSISDKIPGHSIFKPHISPPIQTEYYFVLKQFTNDIVYTKLVYKLD